MIDCQATRYDALPCEGPAKFRILYRSSNGDVVDFHQACFRHGMAEIDRHHRSGGMAQIDMEEVQPIIVHRGQPVTTARDAADAAEVTVRRERTVDEVRDLTIRAAGLATRIGSLRGLPEHRDAIEGCADRLDQVVAQLREVAG